MDLGFLTALGLGLGLGLGGLNLGLGLDIFTIRFWIVQRSPYYPCLKASKRLPEFSGLMGKVYPGQLKPRYQIPEPRIDLNQNGFKGKDNNGRLMPPKIIVVKPV